MNVASLLFCLLVLPFAISNAASSSAGNEHHDNSWQFGDFWCQIVGFLTLLTTSVCSPTIALIAVDR